MRMKRRVLAICLLALACISLGGRWTIAADPVIQGFDYVDADLRDIFRSLGLAGGFNVLLTKDVSGSYTLFIKQAMRVRDAIEMVARTYGYDVRWLNEEKTVVVIGSPETLKQNFDINLGLTKVFTLRYSSVNEIAEALKVAVDAGKISLNPRTNQVVVTGSPLQLENATEIIVQMDHPMPQVNIEARMEEILESEIKELGLTWDATYNLTFGPGLSVINAPQLAAKLNLLHTENKAVTLAQPNASCLDSQEATIFIGDKYPVATAKVVEGTTSWTVTYEDIGTKLTIKPRVNKENVVTVYIKAEVSSILEYKDLKDAGEYPIIRTRITESLTRLRDGQTFVMSGLIRRDNITKDTGIPLLDKLPILSLFFKNKNVDKTSTVICIFLTPHIQQVTEDELSDVSETATTSGGAKTGNDSGKGGAGAAAGNQPAGSDAEATPSSGAGAQPAATIAVDAGDDISAEEMAEAAGDAAAALPVTVDGGNGGAAVVPAGAGGETTPPDAGAAGQAGPAAAAGAGEAGSAEGASGAAGASAVPAAGQEAAPGGALSLPRPEEIRHIAYTVKKGDTLASIGKKFGLDWQVIAGYNKLGKGSTLRVGQQLLVPIPDDRKYVVQPKETLWRIAKRYGVTVELLAEINNLSDPTKIEVGQVIVLPCSVRRIVNPEY